jgi:hypothetical protein
VLGGDLAVRAAWVELAQHRRELAVAEDARVAVVALLQRQRAAA